MMGGLIDNPTTVSSMNSMNSMNSTNNLPNIGTVLPGREDHDADMTTIKLLTEVTALRRQLRALEPQLSKMVTEFGLRRGQSGYREFYLTNELNRQSYTEK